MAVVAKNVAPMFFVFDMRRSVAFYRDVLGFEIAGAYEPDGHLYWTKLQLGGAVVMLNAEFEDDERPAQPPPRSARGVTLYFDCPDVDAAYAFVRAKGVEVNEPQVTYYGMKQLTVTDPDGFDLCFQQRA